MPVPNISNVNYVEILIRRYPELEFRGDNMYDYDSIVMIVGEKPPQRDLIDLWPEILAEILAEIRDDERTDGMTREYFNLQKQVITMMRAMTSNDTTDVQGMLDHWDSL